MTDWIDIHWEFSEKNYWNNNKTYQQGWEEANITKEEAQGWIELGFEPNDLNRVKKWKNFNFFPTETKVWLEVGLDKYEEEFASWLGINNHAPELVKNNLERLRNDYNEHWLTKNYPNHNIKKIDIRGKNLKGELNLSQYLQLESLGCSKNKLTNIILPLIPYGIRNRDFASSLKNLDLSNNNFNRDLSFLVSCINLEILKLGNYDEYRIEQGIYNKFTGSLEPLKDLIKLTNLDISNTLITGSLDYLSGMGQLKELSIGDTDINEVNIDKLPRSLKSIWYSTNERLNCKLTAVVPLLEAVRWGWCDKCKETNTSYKWCQPCAEQEWKQLSGQELINKFIEQQGKDRWGENKLKWISYEEFTDIKHLADGGFSKIYKAKWGSDYDNVVLKSLNHSQNITLEFLTEITNTKLVDGEYSNVVECHGISQDPITQNYLMVMEYMEEDNLREYLRNKDNKFSLEDKLEKLRGVVSGLYNIHEQNLVHQDFHSGNIVGFSITDLGLSWPVNHPKQTGQIFGVLPYVAPEVLQGKPYTKSSDIYSFGIITYEFLANAYPYPEMNGLELSLKVCDGYRPNIDKVPLPQLLKDLIKSCWDSNPNKRPKVEELYKIIDDWKWEIEHKISTPFYQQHWEIATEYRTFFQNIPYQIHTNAITTSKMIDTKQITELLASKNYSLDSLELKFKNAISNYQTKEYDFDITKRLRSMSMEEASQKKTKSVKLDKMIGEPMEIDSFTQQTSQNNLTELNIQPFSYNWTNIHFSFTPQLQKEWMGWDFTTKTTQEWINIGLQPTDYNFCAWLRDSKKLTPEWVLNHENLEQLNQEYFQWWQERQQTNIEQSPK